MPRKVSLPGAAELFRPTHADDDVIAEPAVATPASNSPTSSVPKPSGRIRHDAKITVYVSQSELLALEQARLTLRAEHGVAVDRGRIVREAIATVIAELDELGRDSALVQRLTNR